MDKLDPVKNQFQQFLKDPEHQKKYQEIIEKTMNDKDIQTFIDLHSDQLTKEMIEKSYAKFNEFILERDARKNGQEVKSPGMEPVLAMNLGFVDVIYKPTEAYLQQKRERELRSRVQAMNMPKNIQQARFSELAVTAKREEVVEKALNFIEAHVAEPKKFQKGIYIVGPFGVGKTYLLGAIANELAQNGLITTLVHVPSLSSEMKNAIGEGGLSDKLDAIKKAPILILDDIGAESSSSWFRDEILGVILQYRMQQELPTFFSSNFTIAELEEHLRVSQRGEDEGLKAKRIIERIKFLSTEVYLDGENRRK